MTLEEYFAADETSEVRLEYVDGEVFPIEAASVVHGQISVRLAGALRSRLAKNGCDAAAATRVRAKSGKFLFPDLLAFCGAPVLIEGRSDTIANPKAIFEILSPGTEAYDRGGKFEFYETIDTLEEYVLVSQHKPRIEVFTRAEEAAWIRHTHTGMDATAELKSLGITLPLAEVYADLFDE